MTLDDDLLAANRLVFLHKHGVSARTRFLRFADGGICGFTPLPRDATLAPRADRAVELLPTALLAAAARRLGIAASGLALEADFAVDAFVGGDRVQVHLARFTDRDPPFDLAERIGARFIDLSAARGMYPASLALMRDAYEVVIGG